MVVAVVMGGTLEPGGLLNDPFKPGEGYSWGSTVCGLFYDGAPRQAYARRKQEFVSDVVG